MDHNRAVQMQAAEKYILGELPPPLRDEYEEHFFDCAECAQDVKAAAIFLDNSRDLLRYEPRNEVSKALVPVGSSWFAWLRPVIAVPALTLLLLFVAYQNTVTIPRAKQAAMQNSGKLFASSFSLGMANTRGGEEVKVQVHPNESFALDFDFTPSRTFESYLCQLQEQSGRTLLQVSIPGTSANKEAHLVIPGGLVHPGNYSLVFTGAPTPKGQLARVEVLRLGFAVEFSL